MAYVRGTPQRLRGRRTDPRFSVALLGQSLLLGGCAPGPHRHPARMALARLATTDPRFARSVVERDRLVVAVEQDDVGTFRLVGLGDADRLEDALGDLDHDLGVLRQETLGVLATLTELLT